MQPTLRRVMRLDSMPMPRAYFTPEGFLKDRPVLTSTGIFEYTNPDGSTRRELRLPEDVFSPESLKSYKGKPIVISHEAGLIDKNNVAANQIGTILSEGEQSGNDVKAEIIIHDTDEMKSAGLKELSLGYNLDLDETPGVWNGQRYDAVQKNIRINHLALVREARAGEQARLNLDGRDENVLKGGKRMSNKTKRALHADAVLSDEELDKALEEYDKKYGNSEPAAQTDADDKEEEVVTAAAETTEPTEEAEAAEAAPADEVEDKVAEVVARRDKRDEQGDPNDVDEAMGMIAHQDEDIDSLLDLVDTLRKKVDTLKAQLDFKTAEDSDDGEEEAVEEEEKVVEEDAVDDLEKLKGGNNDAEDDEEELPAEEAETEDDVIPEDEDDEFAEDAADEEEEAEEELPAEEEEEDEFATDGEDCAPETKRMNADSVDRLVNMKIALGELGESVGIKGLARKPVKEAKIAIIRSVRPGVRLDGKSDTYINEAFKMARDEIKARSVKDTNYQKRQMFNKKTNLDSADNDSAEAARLRMMRRMTENGK